MLTYILLQASQGAGQSWQSTAILFGGIILIFYFFMLRPQQKKQKDQKKFLDTVKKGDMVVTIGGMHGKVFSIDKDQITIEVDKGAKIKFDKTSISYENSKIYAPKT